MEGCPRKIFGRGWCQLHYQRWWETGDPGPAGLLRHKPGTVTCSVDDCDRPAKARGWCGMHYQRWAKHGDPSAVDMIIGDDEERFWEKVNPRGPIPAHKPDLGPCWIWTGPINRGGYGRFTLGRKEISAARWICEARNGPIPKGYEPDHLCRNRACVNYLHLEVVTGRENTLRSDNPMAINARKTHCVNDHEFTDANTLITVKPDGSARRSCRTCLRAAQQRYRERRKARRLQEGAARI